MMRRDVVRRAVIVCAVIILVAYTAFEARELIAGPVIVVTSPLSGSVIVDDLVVIAGRAENVVKIEINGREIFITDEGIINEPLPLLPGYNTITLVAWDRFGKEARVPLELLYRPANATPELRLPTPLASSTTATST